MDEGRNGGTTRTRATRVAVACKTGERRGARDTRVSRIGRRGRGECFCVTASGPEGRAGNDRVHRSEQKPATSTNPGRLQDPFRQGERKLESQGVQAQVSGAPGR